jgi:hypothetical protein
MGVAATIGSVGRLARDFRQAPEVARTLAGTSPHPSPGRPATVIRANLPEYLIASALSHRQ